MAFNKGLIELQCWLKVGSDELETQILRKTLVGSGSQWGPYIAKIKLIILK
jgi:hypothetical protein